MTICKYWLLFFTVVQLGFWQSAVAQQQTSKNAEQAGSLLQNPLTKLSEAIKLKTVSKLETSEIDYGAFTALHAYLEEAFPLVHLHLEREVVNNYSLLYTWRGSDTTLNPILLSAHLDVVPVEEVSAEEWKYDPFGGFVAEGYIWGRGSMDDKYRVIAILEAVEQLLQQGYTPDRTVLLAFGHDEETGGIAGAGRISALLGDRNIQLAAVFDEGLAVTERLMPAIDKPVAFIGTASKGNINFMLTVNGEGGHSSVPPSETPISILSEAIARIQEHPFKAQIRPTTRHTLQTLRPEMSGLYKLALGLYPITKGLIKKRLANNQATDALLRTKVVPTIIQAGDKYNVLPRTATAVLNVRILTGETAKSVLTYLEKVVNDERVQLTPYGVYTPPSAVTATDTRYYKELTATIQEVFPGAVVAPALFPGTTDARHYDDNAENVFLFAPQVVTPENATLIHNVNERMAVGVYEKSIQFYKTLLKRVSS